MLSHARARIAYWLRACIQRSSRLTYPTSHNTTSFSINNLGDPFVESNYGVHSRKFEVEVLQFFAALWEIPLDKFWGYTTTCGTEGNLLGILYGREKFPEGVLYCSRESHYSVPKAAKIYRMPVVGKRGQSRP